jgi:hypothetical protein
MTTAFQADAFQSDSFQVDEPAFQADTFQNDSFQIAPAPVTPVKNTGRFFLVM